MSNDKHLKESAPDTHAVTVSISEAAAYPQSHWKLGNEFKPFHPSASHVDPSYRDGWNHAYYASCNADVPSTA